MSRVPAEWGSPPSFFFGNREQFKSWAASEALPRWLRVTYAGYSQVAANGHAVFRQRELAVLLGDDVDHIRVPAIRQRVREAIDGAIERGLLLPESRALCLVVPRSAVVFGVGDADAPCPRHSTKRNDKSVSPETKTTRFYPVVSHEKERQNRVVSGSASLSLSSSARQGAATPAKSKREAS